MLTDCVDKANISIALWNFGVVGNLGREVIERSLRVGLAQDSENIPTPPTAPSLLNTDSCPIAA